MAGQLVRGVSLLAQGRAEDAILAFELVYSELPGELAPKLAMGLARELSGDAASAARHYDVVCSTDPSFAAASFGLARACLAQGDVAGAVDAYERIPPTSSLHAPAQLALARALIAGGRSAPGLDDLVRASSVIARLQVAAEQRADLAADLLEAALALLASGRARQSADAQLLGQPLREAPLRAALEQAYRDLAWAAAGDEKVLLVDRANDARPWTAF